ncbi:MAG TPA: hypothetical protein VHI77_00380 [Solirubrobacterales bacterium]|jgi:hypothetical protein|nr:hypothetical protein [Solirubrobacterales bacterium]
MIVSWILFPVLLAALCLGCGLLLESCAGRTIPGALLAPAGFLVIVVVAGTFTSRGELASLATPAVLLLALMGAALRSPWGIGKPDRAGGGQRPWTRRRPNAWAVGAGLGAFLLFGSPVIFSGHPTFLGYIKLDDTATWMAFVDRVMDHGRNLSGLEPSSYQTTLQVNLPVGYPVGAFLPLGVGTQLLGTDVAWLVQPYIASMAALLALCLYRLAAALVEPPPLRALVAFGAAASALLYAYSLWGGIKEVAVAVAIAVLAALAPTVVARPTPTAGDRIDGRRLEWRLVVPVAVATAALLIIVGAGAAVWIAPILGLTAIALGRARGWHTLLLRAAPLAVFVALLGIPALFAAGAFSPTQGGLTNASELGNLIGPLNVAQLVGIWPTGDFRLDPINGPLTTFLIALALIAAAVGACFCWRRRAWEPLLYAVGATGGSLAAFAYSSPWVGAKALASASPALLLLAFAGAAAFALRVERVLGATVLGLLLVGVLWSNALGYHDVNLAPYDQLRELETIGNEFAGEGPALMTEYQPYGVRHFLRKLDAEGASELRARSIPLRDGGELEKGDWGDTDQIELLALLTYRTLVLRRNPAQSRPPSAYEPVRQGEYYEVWQRPPRPSAEIAEHLPLGDFEDPSAVPACPEVERLAEVAGPEGTLIAPERGPNDVASLSRSSHPASWVPLEAGSAAVVPRGPGTAEFEVTVAERGRYGLYVQGSTRNRLTAFVDGIEVGSADQQLNEGKQSLYFGEAPLAKGGHRIALVLDGQTLGPGSGGPPEAIGPMVLSPAVAENPPLRELPSSRASALCGRRLDWIEAVR